MRFIPLLFLLLQDADIQFTSFTLAMHGDRQDTVVYDFNGDGRADVLCTCIDTETEPPTRWAFFYYQKADGSFESKPDRALPIPRQVVALVYGDFDGDAATEVGFLASDGVYFFPKDSDKPVKLIHTAVFFTAPSDFIIPVWQYRQDLDGNGLDDLLVPVDKGYKVYFQTEKGKFGRISSLESDDRDPSRRALKVSSRATQDRYRSSTLRFEKLVPRLEAVDIDGDGKKDLVSISKDLLTVFFMSAEGTYDPKAREIREVKTLSSKEQADSVEVTGIQFIDLNGDKLPELVVTKIEGQLGMVESLQTNIYIHRGNGKAAFTPEQSLLIPGLSIFPTFIDMDGDGKLDLYATFVSTGVIQKLLEAKIMGDVNITTGVWRCTDEGYKDMDYTKDLLVKSEVIEKRSGVPVVYIGGDFNGDKRPDMIIVQPGKEIGIHMGRKHYKGGSTTIGFEANPSQSIPITDQPDFVQFFDINGDGITDLICTYKGSATLVISKRH